MSFQWIVQFFAGQGEAKRSMMHSHDETVQAQTVKMQRADLFV
jgi:hypothetical protein